MLRLVAYDIADKKRLRRVAKVCDRFGVRVEKSVFESRLDEAEFHSFWAALEREIDPSSDALVCYPLCSTCEAKILLSGNTVRPALPPAAIVA